MNLPLTSLALIALLLPGVAFFYISALRQRRNTDLVRTNVLGDISIVVAVSFAVHTVLMLIIRFCYSSLYYDVVSIIIFYDERALFNTYLYIDRYLINFILYFSASIVIGIGMGLLISTKYFGSLFRNKWSRDLYGNQRRLISVYVMTNVKENSKVLLYKGTLKEYLMGSDGNFLYVVLQNAKRYFLNFDTDVGKMSEQLDLFGGRRGSEVTPMWNYLVIPGGSISNILFEKSPELNVNPEAEKLLDEALTQSGATVD